MHAGKNYTLREFLFWTRRSLYALTLLAVAATALYDVAGWKWLSIPWVPVTLLGTAAAFIAGFRNNATYNRSWEARQIWGGIVNASRTWGIMVKDFVRPAAGQSAEGLRAAQQQLIYRHVAWLTALRFQLREPRAWENMTKPYNAEYRRLYQVDEHDNQLPDELTALLSAADKAYVLGKKNRATQLLSLQSAQLRELSEAGHLTDLRYTALVALLRELYDQQGRSERIKNFPYPRQFATINQIFIQLFVVMVPFGLLKEFDKLGGHLVWLTIPFSVLVSWVFTTLEQVGEATENPFEGSANDTPITAMSRTIEIDLREMFDETNLPPAVQPVHDILL